jgi:large subunit ribosomal protein L18
MITKPNRKDARRKRHYRIRKNVIGTTERPRLCVFRSNKHMYAQVIDDANACTIVSASTLDKEFKDKVKTWSVDGAKVVGELVAKRAKEKGVESVVFDRGGNIYHGRIAAVAESAREAGLVF